LLHGPQAAELPIHIDQLAGESLELTEPGDLTFRLTDGCLSRQILRDGFAVDFLSELKMRAVSGIIGFGAMTSGAAAPPGGTGDGAWLKVCEFGDLPEQRGSVVD